MDTKDYFMMTYKLTKRLSNEQCVYLSHRYQLPSNSLGKPSTSLMNELKKRQIISNDPVSLRLFHETLASAGMDDAAAVIKDATQHIKSGLWSPPKSTRSVPPDEAPENEMHVPDKEPPTEPESPNIFQRPSTGIKPIPRRKLSGGRTGIEMNLGGMGGPSSLATDHCFTQMDSFGQMHTDWMDDHPSVSGTLQPQPPVPSAESYFDFEELLDNISRELSDDQKLLDHFQIESSELNPQVIYVLWEKEIFTEHNLNPLIEGLKAVDQHQLAAKVSEFQRRTDVMTSEYDRLHAEISTHLTTAQIRKIIEDYSAFSQVEDEIISESNSPGVLFLRLLHEKDIISPTCLEPLRQSLEKYQLYQAVVKIDEYESSIRQKDRPLERRPNNLDCMINAAKAKLKCHFESMSPVPWKKSCQWRSAELYIERRLMPAGQHLSSTSGSTERLLDILSKASEAEKSLIIEGPPGCGKTMLSSQIAYSWSIGKLTDFDLVLFLPMKLIGDNDIFQMLKEYYFPSDDSVVTTRDFRDILSDSSTSVCIILDSLEEYTGNKFTQFIERDDFRRCTVVTTARTDVARDIESCVKYSIRPFSKENTIDYIRNTFPENEEEREFINETIYNNPFVAELCKIPLLFVLVVHLFESVKDNTFSHITSFMRNIIRALCPPGESNNILHIGELAFNGLCNGKQQLSWPKSFIENKLLHLKNWIDCGIFIVDNNFAPTRRHSQENDIPPVEPSNIQNKETRHVRGAQGHSSQDRVESLPRADKIPQGVRFLHKVLQEWFAAYHIAHRIEKLDDILDKINPVELHLMLRFVCGLKVEHSKPVLDHLLRRCQVSGRSQPGFLTCILLVYSELENIPEELVENAMNVYLVHEREKRGLELTGAAKIGVDNLHEYLTKQKLIAADIGQTCDCSGYEFHRCENQRNELVFLQCKNQSCLAEWLPGLKSTESNRKMMRVGRFYSRGVPVEFDKSQMRHEPIDRCSQLSPGDHIVLRRGWWFYDHHAIVLKTFEESEIKVIEWQKVKHRNAIVITSNSYPFPKNRLKRQLYGAESPADITVARALHMKRTNSANYHVTENNCETLATYCKTGVPFTAQGEVGRNLLPPFQWLVSQFKS